MAEAGKCSPAAPLIQLQYAVIYVPFPFRPSAKRQHRRSRHIQHGADDEAAAAAALRMGLQAAEAAAAARPPSRLRSRSHSQHSLLAMGAAGSRSR